MTEDVSKSNIDNHSDQYGNWILGLHYDKETKKFRRYDLTNVINGKLILKYTDKLYDINGNVVN